MPHAIKEQDCKPVEFRTLKIFLAGPFAIVLRRSDPTSPISGVTAFVPRHEHHEFYFDRDPQNTNINYFVELDPVSKTYLGVATYPDIDHGCDDFNCGTDWDGKADHFLTIDLPCPERITYSGHAIDATFKNKETGYLPLNHILEYTVEKGNKGIKLLSRQLGDRCLPDGKDTFLFEIGLPKKTSPKHSRKHAVQFFNTELLPHFKRIKTKMRLSRVRDTRGRTGSEAPFVSTAVECQNGGLIAITP